MQLFLPLLRNPFYRLGKPQRLLQVPMYPHTCLNHIYFVIYRFCSRTLCNDLQAEVCSSSESHTNTHPYEKQAHTQTPDWMVVMYLMYPACHWVGLAEAPVPAALPGASSYKSPSMNNVVHSPHVHKSQQRAGFRSPLWHWALFVTNVESN